MAKTNRVAVALAILLGSVLIATNSSGAQVDSGTLRIRVVYPDGSLASDASICLSGFTDEAFVFGSGAADRGADSTWQLPPDDYYFYNACQGDASSEIASVWNTGDAVRRNRGVPNSDVTLDARSIPGRVPATVRPGETTIVTLTTGAARITGTLVGDSLTSRRCTVEAVGKPIGAFTESAVHGVVTFDGPNYELFVPPGNYRVSAICRFASAPRYWPNNTPFVDNAQIISVAHGQTISGIDFTPPRSNGTSSVVAYTLADSLTTPPHCVDYQRDDLDGATVQRQFNVRGATFFTARLAYGDYKLRFWDCTGQGFDDVWYPYSPTYEGGETIQSSPTEFDVNLPVPVAIIPDPAHLCGGRRATILGTDEADDIVGTEGNDVIVGLGGNDLIRGMGGNDVICGGPGRDRIFGGHGRDLLFGGNQNDILRGEGGKDVLHGGRGNDLIVGGGRDDTLFGGPGRDKLFGGPGRDRLLGGNKNDFLRGDGGRDTLDGGRGNDILIGGGGNDGLFGGPGPIDRLFGKAGFDLCVDAQPDTIIRECEIGVDPFGD